MLTLLASAVFAQTPTPDAEFEALKRRLERAGFEVRLSPPPQSGAYGQLAVKTRIIWIHPIVFELHIARPTLIHEATHAAQVCAGGGKIQPLGLSLEPINYARPFFFHYQHPQRRDLEREAYAVQTQPNSYELVTALLNQHCPGGKS